MRPIGRRLAVVAATLATPATALAEPGAHDGFYLSAGPGVFAPYVAQSRPDNRWGGLVSGFALTLGGTPLPGLVVGGDLSSMTLERLHGRDGGVFGDNAAYTAVKGAIVFYPAPRRGHFVEAGLGFGTVSRGTWPSVGAEQKAKDEKAAWAGAAGHLGVGMGVFFSDDLSAVVKLRLEAAPSLGASTDGPKDARKLSLVAPFVGVAIVWH